MLKFIIVFFLLNILSYNTINNIEDEKIDAEYKLSLKSLENHYNIFVYEKSLDSDKIYDDIQNNNYILNMIYTLSKTKDIDTQNNLKRVLSNIKNITNSDINDLQFISADNIVLFNYFSSDNLFYNVENTRLDIVNIHNTKSKSNGYHSGKLKNGFRYLYPLYIKVDNKEQYIGVLDISYSSNLLQYFLTNISKIHTHFLISKDIFFKNHIENSIKDLYATSAENKNSMLKLTPKHPLNKCVVANHEKLTKIQSIINNNMKNEIQFSIYNLHPSYNDRVKLISFYPIKDSISNKVVAWLVSYEYSQHIKDILYRKNIYYIISFLIILILSYFLYHISKEKRNLKRLVNRKTKELKRTNQNLESIIKEKTKELVKINENLKSKIDKELKKSRDKDKKIIEQSKMAALGEMIGNIAHQWRQPLSIISTSATSMKFLNEMGNLTTEKLNKNCDLINNNTQFLSKTIDDFKNFIQENDKKTTFMLSTVIDKVVHLIDSTLKENEIKVIINIKEDIELCTYKNQLIQSLINITNNSKDAFCESSNSEKLIIFTVFKDKNNAIIKITDNAGGIPEKIISKIFEPYFTTKHKSQGTGLGLHMTYNMITNGINGTIKVKNKNFKYNHVEYKGASFTIVIPI